MKKTIKILSLIISITIIFTLFAGCAITPEQKLVGSWRDTTGSIGYDFHDDGTATIHYADFTIPVINYKYDGNLSATYSTSKTDDGVRHINLHYSIIGSISVDEDFTYKIEGSVLTITNVKTNQTYSLVKADQNASLSTDASVAQ